MIRTRCALRQGALRYCAARRREEAKPVSTSRHDPSTAQQTVTVASPQQPLVTDGGARLTDLDLVYETWGALNSRRDNAVLVFHALTGDSHVASHPEVPDDRPGWWEPVVGPGRTIDTDHWFVICVNAPGSCYGSTGPCSIAPDGRRYGLRFPPFTVGDLVRAQARVLDHLGIRQVEAVIGGSLGGMEALEFAVAMPSRTRQAVVIAATARFHAQGIAYNEIQRRAIMLDPAWNNGEYDESAAPRVGVAVARMLGMLTYQSADLMDTRFGRNPARYSEWPEFAGRYDVEGYLHYQGDKLADRFDANTYLYLSRAMDSHDIGAGRGGLLEAAARIRASCLFVGISSDVLFPATYVEDSAGLIRQTGGQASYVEIESIAGHDAFLKEWDALDQVLTPVFNLDLAGSAAEIPRWVRAAAD